MYNLQLVTKNISHGEDKTLQKVCKTILQNLKIL